MEKVRVGVLGSGDVGKVLAGGFIKLGHDVKIGSRDPEKLREWVEKAGEHASAGTFEETAKFGDVLVLATLGAGAESALQMAGPDNFAGKVVIDATNPLDFSTGAPKLSVGFNDSLGEQVQRWIPKARVVKAFNTVGNAHMINPDFPNGPPDMFLCGNDDDAKKIVTQVCKHWGWGVIDLGGIESSRYLEPMCMTWVLYGVKAGSWNHAFKMLQK
jgi:8-hydroxy-5-deazaflavin:NADPH oxidoreductase